MRIHEALKSLADIAKSDEARELPIDRIHPREKQQRKHFDDKKINLLAESIKQIGVKTPIEVIEITEDERYEIISGERRYRAAKKVGLTLIPTIIRKNKTEASIVESQFAENIQREDLNAVEKALAITDLMGIEGYSQKKISEICGKSKAWVSKQLKILDQSTTVQELAKKGLIRDLNTLYDIAELSEEEINEISNLAKQGNFNYKEYKNKSKNKAEEKKFSFNLEELAELIELTGFRNNPVKVIDLNKKEARKLYKDFKQWLHESSKIL